MSEVKRSSEKPGYTLEIEGTEKYSSLSMLQSVLLEPLVEALAIVVREKLLNGELQLVGQAAARA